MLKNHILLVMLVYSSVVLSVYYIFICIVDIEYTVYSNIEPFHCISEFIFISL